MNNFNCPNGCCKFKIDRYKPIRHIYKKNIIRKKAGVFIYDPKTDKILLVQSRGHLWGPPKGTIKFGETETECAVREVKEETGLSISPNSLSKSLKIYHNAIYFYIEMDECEVNVQNHIVGNDANAICWIKLNCLEKCMENGDIFLSKHCKIAIKKFKNINLPTSTYCMVEKNKRK